MRANPETKFRSTRTISRDSAASIPTSGERRPATIYRSTARLSSFTTELQRSKRTAARLPPFWNPGKTAAFRKVILAYGVRDQLPEIEGPRALWGKAVFHCPYCHGFEVQDQKLGVIGNGGFIEHMLPMIRSLSEDLVIFTQGKATVQGVFAAGDIMTMQHSVMGAASTGQAAGSGAVLELANENF